uniref:adenylate cyclase n=1 Tax=Meloidogyne floridensis TaxID=298350 RepID=A0A915NNE3_9BILA
MGSTYVLPSGSKDSDGGLRNENIVNPSIVISDDENPKLNGFSNTLNNNNNIIQSEKRRRKDRFVDYSEVNRNGVSITLIENNLGSLPTTSQKVQPVVFGQILVCLGILLFICALESLCRTANLLLTISAFIVSMFLPIGQHLCLVLLAVTWHRLPVFSILWLPSCISHMCLVFALYRLPYSLRCFLASLDCGFFLILLVFFSTSVSNVLQSAPIISCQITICFVNMISLLLLLIFITRITEYERKSEASCNVAFKNEERDVQLMQDINRELYARDHDNMFASIPNFKEYWSECDHTRKLECLRLLNEIVCEFDKLLSKPKFSCIEKIKTVASTYMAAAGLTDSDNADNSPERNAVVIVEFAQAMASVLDQLNIDSFQNFELRIGINVGPVVAGVLGQKPQYDIWGNSVNIASRMDSSGVIGYIQVNEETKQILSKKKSDYQWIYRGEINIKGKGPMITYLLKLSRKNRINFYKLI